MRERRRLIFDNHGMHILIQSTIILVTIENDNDEESKAFLKSNKIHSSILLGEIVEEIEEICCDKSGCCFIQQFFDILDQETQVKTFDLIISYAKSFLDHEYANYVIQYIISKNIPYYNEILLSLIMENMLKYSKNKSSSNIIERLLNSCKVQRKDIIEKVSENKNLLKEIILDEYGQYVFRCILDHSTEFPAIYDNLIKLTLDSLNELAEYVHGEKFIRKLMENHPRLKKCLNTDFLISAIFNKNVGEEPGIQNMNLKN